MEYRRDPNKCISCRVTLTEKNGYIRGATGQLMEVCRECSKSRVLLNTWQRKPPKQVLSKIIRTTEILLLLWKALETSTYKSTKRAGRGKAILVSLEELTEDRKTMSIIQMAKKYDCSPATVWLRLKEHGLCKNKRTNTKLPPNAKLVELLKAKSVKELAKEYGVHPEAIYVRKRRMVKESPNV